MNEANISFDHKPVYFDHGDLSAIFLRISSDQIVELNFLLESYDGLGVLRTLDAGHGEVVVLTTRDMESQVLQFLEAVGSNLQIKHIQPPSSLASDWLLSECLD